MRKSDRRIMQPSRHLSADHCDAPSKARGGLLREHRRYLQGQIKFVGRLLVGWMDGLVDSRIEAKTSRVGAATVPVCTIVLSFSLPHGGCSQVRRQVQ